MSRKQIWLAAVASVLFSALTQAGESGPAVSDTMSKAIYEGVDANGRLIRLTIADVNVEAFSRVRPEDRPEHAAAHWTHLIGTGTAAQAERKP
jgi:hypothetical protein